MSMNRLLNLFQFAFVLVVWMKERCIVVPGFYRDSCFTFPCILSMFSLMSNLIFENHCLDVFQSSSCGLVCSFYSLQEAYLAKSEIAAQGIL